MLSRPSSVRDDVFGVALLNDCKYGYDVLNGTVRITLIKAATAPDQNADQGHHQFTYALLPFDAENPEELDQEAYDLNAPLRVLPATTSGHTPARFSVATSAANVIIETVKPTRDGTGIILRLFETQGQHTNTTVFLGKVVEAVKTATIFEDEIDTLGTDCEAVSIAFSPFAIVTLIAFGF